VERTHKAGARQHLRDIRADLPEEFVQTVERALATDPRERYQSAGAFESALARFLGAAGHTERGWITVNWRHTAVGVAAFAIVAAVAVPYWMSVRNSPRTSGTAGTVEDVAGRTDASSATPLRVADGRQPYTINTAVYRDVSGQRQRLRPGARVKPGDRLFVEVNASVPTYLYVVNEDEQGSALLLYPLPGQNATNPLPAGQSNRLPGARGGDEVFWVVDKNGGREHLLIFASPERLSEFEPVFASLGRPEAGRQIPPALVGRLRSIGGLATAPRPSGPSTATPRTSGPLTQLFTTPLGDAEENVRGAWIRQLTLENSSR
jgi:hypothetical protein